MNRLLYTLLTWCLVMGITGTMFAFTRQDTLRGSNGRGRLWWDVQHYELHVAFDTAGRSIQGYNKITAKILSRPYDSLQLDLQEPMVIDSVILRGRQLPVRKEGNVWWVLHTLSGQETDASFSLEVYYHGRPSEAKLPPWQGGFIWTKDSTGKPWISVACQGTGASSWWPCKDFQGDEPDQGVALQFFVPENLYCISNGRLAGHYPPGSHTNSPFSGRPLQQFIYRLQNPVNAYNISFYIGDYVSWEDTLQGIRGRLDIRYHALRAHEQKARMHFSVVPSMLHCFEYWMGPYPFYEDGYQLVEAPFLGMEHQSAVAYGNAYRMGYMGTDRSGTGVGLQFDHLIVHESGHEWFGNNITAYDMADNWIHEGFTSYTEVLFIECRWGKEQAYQYSLGTRQHIRNDRPVTGRYGVHQNGSSDQYDKGAAVVHMIRKIIDDDNQFRGLLHALNRDYYHQTVEGTQFENYISNYTGYDFKPLFDQYLRTVKIPVLEWHVRKKRLYYRFTHAVSGFTLPLLVKGTAGEEALIRPASEWQSVRWKSGFHVSFPEDFLIEIK